MPVRKMLTSCLAAATLSLGTLTACVSEEQMLEEQLQTFNSRDEDIPPEPQYQGEARTEIRTIKAGGLERGYRVSIPPEIEKRSGIPLIFAFHGFEGSAKTMEQFTDFDAAEAVVVYADGVNKAWAPAPYAETTGEQDLAFYDQVREKMIAEFPVHPHKVFVTGLSNGGGFAAFIGCNRAHQIAGVATVSAAFYEGVFDDCTPIPVKHIDFHGTDDSVMKYGGGERHGRRYMAMEDVLKYAAKRNHCNPQPIISQSTRAGVEQNWVHCDAQLRHFRLDGGRHVWPGGAQEIVFDGADGFASRQILNFFGVKYRAPLATDLQ
ncbi:alpha/beta hydrolase family esterase [Corynebacterium aquatimens]|uniref:Polyhydroxybutyrate depolymerase n=1 Tax=Corynebacterium aquatimens TaxID=1190508 RepID=A0A931GS08_9CORY|nr:hypothetical protein [Corynebacterium aquatimens]MBG6121557.1 polyhydroxybutyrate depolymerase [Corynebacterium aquatimens]